MAIVEDRDFAPLAHEDDPDDYRPDSELAVVLDPSDEDGEFVSGLTVFYERIAPGDEIPLHQHTLEEVFFVDEGRVEATVGDDRDVVGPGVTVFVPAGTPHGFRNVGDGVARVHAVFPGPVISIRYLERNPAPGTEGDPPGAPVSFDMRELVEGDPDGEEWREMISRAEALDSIRAEVADLAGTGEAELAGCWRPTPTPPRIEPT